MRPTHAFLVPLLLAVTLTTPVRAGDFVLLDATFDDKTVDAPIGTGGALVGEPVSISPGIDVIVRDGVFVTPSLEIADQATLGTPFVRFEFVDSFEETAATVEITALLRFSEVDGYVFYVREQGTSGSSFSSVTFTSGGTLTITDAAGVAFSGGSYAADTDHLLEITHDLLDGTWDLSLDGTPHVTNRSHGITDRGIGAILIGVQNDAELDGSIHLDRIRVTSDGLVPAASGSWGAIKALY